MQFNNSIWLWGLVGLAIPITIHLLSRKESKTIFIGSIRHLQESATAQFRSIRLNEVILLLLRCVLLTLLVLFLAEALLPTGENKKEQWLVIEKGIEQTQEYKSIANKLKTTGFEIRYLAKDFPLLDDSTHVDSEINYWALAEQLAAKGIDSVIVLSYNYHKNFKGERISKPNINWITNQPQPEEAIVKSIAITNDSVWVRRGTFTSDYTALQTQTEPATASVQAARKETIRISIVTGKEFQYDGKILTAAFKSLQTIYPHTLVIKSTSDLQYQYENEDWIIWLSDKQMPSTPNDSSQTIGFKKCSSYEGPIITESNSLVNCTTNFDWIITSRLNEEIALDKNFVTTLAQVVTTAKDIQVEKHDKRVMAEASMWSQQLKPTALAKPTDENNLDKLLTILILAILALERWLSFKRNQ